MAALLGPQLQQARAITQEPGHKGPVKDSGAKELEEPMEDKHLVMETKPKTRNKLHLCSPKPQSKQEPQRNQLGSVDTNSHQDRGHPPLRTELP